MNRMTEVDRARLHDPQLAARWDALRLEMIATGLLFCHGWRIGSFFWRTDGVLHHRLLPMPPGEYTVEVHGDIVQVTHDVG